MALGACNRVLGLVRARHGGWRVTPDDNRLTGSARYALTSFIRGANDFTLV